MKVLRSFIVCFLLCSCGSVNVDYDYDSNLDFSSYKTFNFYDEPESGLSELDHKRLVRILSEELQKKGLEISEDPDFLIGIQSEEYERENGSGIGVGVGGTGGNVGGGISVGIPMRNNKLERDIIFDFIDEKGIGVIWQALSTSSFNPDSNPEQREANLRAVVQKVLAKFPPEK